MPTAPRPWSLGGIAILQKNDASCPGLAASAASASLTRRGHTCETSSRSFKRPPGTTTRGGGCLRRAPRPYTDPTNRFSCMTNGNIGNAASASPRARPVSTTVPPLRAARQRLGHGPGVPTVSNTKSAPRPAVRSRTASAVLPAALNRVGCAELFRAISSGAGRRSTATIELRSRQSPRPARRSSRRRPPRSRPRRDPWRPCGCRHGADPGDHGASERRQCFERHIRRTPRRRLLPG